MKETRQKEVHTVWFHLDETLENTNKSVMTGNRSMVACGEGGEDG